MTSASCRGLGAAGFHRVNYYQWGDPDNPRVVICVHGLTRNGRDFDWLASRLSDDFRVICPDVVGRGKSDWLSDKSGYQYAQYLADMSVLIARCNVEQVDLVGTSMGGLIGMMLAAQPNTPVARLVLNDVGPQIAASALARISEYVGKDVGFADLDSMERYLRDICADFGPLTDAQWRHLTEHGAVKRGDAYAFAYVPAIARAFDAVESDVDLWPVWDAVTQEVLVLRGARSDLLTRETAARRCRSCPDADVVRPDRRGGRLASRKRLAGSESLANPIEIFLRRLGLEAHPADERRHRRLLFPALLTDHVVSHVGGAENVEQFDQPALGEVIGNVRASREGDSLIVDSRLNRHPGIGKPRALGKRLDLDARVAEPIAPPWANVGAVAIQQRIVQQVGRRRRRAHACEKPLGAHREDVLAEQQPAVHVRPVSQTQPNRDIDVGVDQVDHLLGGADPDLEIAVRRFQSAEPRHEPFHRERRHH